MKKDLKENCFMEIRKVNLLLWCVILLLLVFGFMIQLECMNCEEYLRVIVPISLCVFMVFSFFANKALLYEIVKKESPIIYVIMLVMTLLLLSGLGTNLNGTRRWYIVDGFRIVSPSVGLLIATILLMAYLNTKEKEVGLDLKDDVKGATSFEMLKILFFKTYKLLIPLISVGVMYIIDRFPATYMIMLVILFVFGALFEETISQKIKYCAFYFVFGFLCFELSGMSRALQQRNYTMNDLYLTRRSVVFGGDISGLQFGERDTFLIFLKEFGVVGVIVGVFLFCLLFYCLIRVYFLTKQNGDIFGTIVTMGVLVHLLGWLVAGIVTNLYQVYYIISIPFVSNESGNVILFIFELLFIQAVLVENKSRR